MRRCRATAKPCKSFRFHQSTPKPISLRRCRATAKPCKSFRFHQSTPKPIFSRRCRATAKPCNPFTTHSPKNKYYLSHITNNIHISLRNNHFKPRHIHRNHIFQIINRRLLSMKMSAVKQ